MNIAGVFGEKRAKIEYYGNDNKSQSSYIAQSASSKKDTVRYLMKLMRRSRTIIYLRLPEKTYWEHQREIRKIHL